MICRRLVIVIVTTGFATAGLAADAWPKSSWSKAPDPVTLVHIR